ncbi:MAG: hypothetical protein KJ060_02520 [Candidatus Hydrogenedentes bacterium]|nr:hypothetical protein [Candidatus Hydrogenedentota bacterium]
MKLLHGSVFLLVGTLAASFACAVVPEPPPSPPPGEWAFVDALAAPIQWHPHWTREDAQDNEIDLKPGVRIEGEFLDPEGLLDTAYADLNAFFAAVDIPTKGPFRIVTEQSETTRFEVFRLVVSEQECRIQANDSEGIRRAIFFLEDTLLSADGPFLTLGVTERSPFIHTRISRCFFGPIKRPPKNKDELLDDVDYYPGDYLNKLAHDGVNGLWLTIEFKDICKTSLTPVVDPDRERRLQKLRETIAKCRRYGIKVYLFCIEPRVMDPDHPLLQAHPEIGSKPFSGTGRLFCPFSDAAQTYLYEAMHDIFTEAPNLGGLINISFGERSTTCLSGADENWNIACPVCKEKPLGDILRASLSAMERGMHDANPGAKLISWLYVPGNGTGAQRSVEPLIDIAASTPPGVICQYNFESDGTKDQLGKERHAGDYWLSFVGPSDTFERIANAASGNSVEMGAKLQACTSFEVSTVPYVPVPGNLFRKYQAMRRLGVTSVMQCWYIGSMPSVMNRAAANVLPSAPEGLTEEVFLLELARRDWGVAHAPDVVRAWRLFAEAYDNYPLTNAFQYYGPMHDGIVWPLYLKPAHQNLSPVWKLEFPPSGDRIGECFSGSHTFDEMLTLCQRMSDQWQEGVKVLREVAPAYADDPARQLDLTVAEALGVQFRTGYNIFRFYHLREDLLYGSTDSRPETLRRLREIVEEEIENTERMIALCDANPFLGFQAEAEGYTYSPDELRWRIERLRDLLNSEFVEAEAAVAAGSQVFPVESGTAESAYYSTAARVDKSFMSNWEGDTVWEKITRVAANDAEPAWSWQAAQDREFLYIHVNCAPSEQWRAVGVAVAIEPSQIYPRRTFRADVHGKRDIRQGWLTPDMPWEFTAPHVDGRQTFRLRIPLDGFQGEIHSDRPLRMNVHVTYLARAGNGDAVSAWVPPSQDRVQPRLGYGSDNPSEMGWLRLE